MTNTDDLGKLVLRVTLAILILFHGVGKIMGGPGFVMEVVGKLGLPEALGYFVYVGEVIAPGLLLVGLWARVAAGLIAANMIVAVLLVHKSQLSSLSNTGGWALELQGMFLFSAVALVMLGAGRFSIGGSAGKWN